MNSIKYIKGVGDMKARLLSRLSIFTPFDLLCHFPRDYEDRTKRKDIKDIKSDEAVCIRGQVVTSPVTRAIRKNLTVTRFKIADDTGLMDIVFFNNRFIADKIRQGESYTLFGTVTRGKGQFEMHNPDMEQSESHQLTGRILPVYPLTAGLTRNFLRKLLEQVIKDYLGEVPDAISPEIREKYHLSHIHFAYENIHFPSSFEALDVARRRLIFEEFFVLSAGLLLLKNRREKLSAPPFEVKKIDDLIASLPFQLTVGQISTIRDVLEDMVKPVPANRLISGDVGSGKTVCAAAAIYFAYKNNYQAALMAPTEILANQHFKTLSGMLSPFGLNIELLSGSLTKATKQKIKERLKDGKIDLIIGTHALLTEDTEFQNLGLVIGDEQHRFGVVQRAKLTAKGNNPHLVVMSATPIPRTLGLILYGDLELSEIRELPPGRKPVDTLLINDKKRADAYGFIVKNLREGRQAFIVCPLIEESEALNAKAVETFTEEVKRLYFREFNVAFLHGKMKAAEKEKIMAAFLRGEISVLVSTTVIEVGIDVPNANILVIENAERFGLSQLHQLRGRVGRGEHKSYCILFSDKDIERLKIFEKTANGFDIAEMDLKLRGPGDFFGTMQHGLPNLKIASFANDMSVLKEAQEAAKKLLGEDTNLSKPENKDLLTRIHMLFTTLGSGNPFN